MRNVKRLNQSLAAELAPRSLPAARAAQCVTLIIAIMLPAIALADNLVLRDATIITGKRVVSMTVDGVRLDDGTTLTWDVIEAGSVEGRQELFEKYVKNLGGHLFRIRRRMEDGDYRSLLAHAEEVAKYYADSQSETAYMVMQGLMWGRLADGQREAAAAPYLWCLEYLRHNKSDSTSLPGKRRLAFDAQTGVSSDLPPVWFDPAAAKEAMPEVAAAVGRMKQPRPAAARVYYATLALAAGQQQTADRVLDGLDADNVNAAQLRDITIAQQEVLAGSPGAGVERLEKSLDQFTATNKPLALYWLGLAKAASKNEKTKKEGVLHLLYLPAIYGAQQPDLAAAALHRSMQALEEMGSARGSIAVRSELRNKYGQTYHAKKLSSEVKPAEDDPL